MVGRLGLKMAGTVYGLSDVTLLLQRKQLPATTLGKNKENDEKLKLRHLCCI